MFLWRLWMEFWQSCEYLLSDCSNFSARNPKNVLKKQFFHQFFRPTFFCISKLFLWHPDCFLSVYRRKLLKLQNRWTNKTFSRKNLLLRKCLWTRGLQLWQAGKKFSFRLSVFWIRVRKKCKVWKIIYISKIVFPQKLPRIHRLRVSQLWQKISLEVNIGSESEKKSEFFSFGKKFSYTVPADIYCCFANPGKVFPSLSRKLQKVFENPRVFKTSSRKICSVNVPLDTSKYFWQPCQKLSCKNTGFACQNPKKTKNQLLNSFFWRFFLCTLRLLLQHTWLIFFAKSRKKSLKVQKEMIIVKITLKIFSKFCWGHVNCTLATCRIFLPKYGNFRSETKNDQRITLLSK